VLAAARRIASGDLSEDVEALDSEDEAGEFARCLDGMQGSLRSMVQSSINCSRRIAAASETISVVTRQQTQSAGVQHEQTELVGAAVREIAVTSKDISEQSGCAAALTRQFAETAGKGGAAVEAMSLQALAISESIEQTSKRIGELGKSGERIAQIAAVIDDLAGQSNLLLLNASIEAASASDKGRGFVRVADEVTKFAERTTRATREIGIMVAQIQIRSRNAMASMGDGTTQAETSAQAARSAEELMHAIIVDSGSLSGTVARIATVAERQIKALNQIVPSLDQISKVTFESSASAQRSADAAEQLAEVVEELQNFPTRFPTREETTGHQRDFPAWSQERVRSFPPEIAGQSNGRTVNGLSVAPRASVNPAGVNPVGVPVSINPGRARIHARLVTPETNPESQPRAPSAAS
jgi:methyl-accepting chemotaxis protein